MARRTLLIVASILLAALGTALIWLYVQGAENRAQQSVDLVPALFLTRNVGVGDSPVGAVTTLQLPASAAGGAVSSISQLGNQKLTVQAVAGQVLLKSMLGTAANAAVERFPAGGAAAVTISDPNRVPRELRVGDSVDVVELTKNKAEPIKDLSNVTVRTIGSAATAAAAKGAAAAGSTAAGSTAAGSTAAGSTAAGATAAGSTAAGSTAAGSTAAGANGTAQNEGISAAIVGLDVSHDQALTLYSIVARGGQIALYLHDPPRP